MMHFSPGLPVAHQKFGIGFVTSISGNNITVKFADAGTKKVVGSFLRKPTVGLLPYQPLPLSDGANLAQFAGRGNVAFTVVDAGIDEFVGATVAQFIVADRAGKVAAVDFFLEHNDAATLREHLERFDEFCRALGVAEPVDTDDFTGLRGCLRVSKPADFPSFARLAS